MCRLALKNMVRHRPPGQRSLHVLTVAGELQSLQSHTSVPREPKQIGQLHEFGGYEGQDDVHESIAEEYGPPQSSVHVFQTLYGRGGNLRSEEPRRWPPAVLGIWRLKMTVRNILWIEGGGVSVTMTGGRGGGC